MDPRPIVTREELQDVQRNLKRVYSIQQHQDVRLRMVEKRQADDAALKSVWNLPFPSVLCGTLQHGPVHMPSNEASDELDTQGQNLIGKLQLDADDEPIRRGVTSRANSVRFDESATWGGHGRQSSEFGSIRPSSGMGGHQLMERSLSHRSDGRHSSAGHSVHFVHSTASGRASSLGLDTNFTVGGQENESPLDIPEPPPGVFFLGSAPSIIRCWLTANFTSSSLLYAVVCTGSQRSTVEYSLVKELDLINSMQRDVDGVHRIALPVFLAEARVIQSNSRSTSPTPQLPSITSTFEVTGMDHVDSQETKKGIRIFVGSHTLRLHSADLLLSQNSMTLYGSDRDKLSVPFVRPENDRIFRHLTTTNIVPGRPRLNAAAPEFVSGDRTQKSSIQDSADSVTSETKIGDHEAAVFLPSPTSLIQSQTGKETGPSVPENGTIGERQAEDGTPDSSGKGDNGPADGPHRETNPAAIRTPWRQTGMSNGHDHSHRENTPLSGYRPANRSRSMKVLRPSKPSTASSARTGPTYEAGPTPRSSGDGRRKSQAYGGAETGTPSASGAARWGDSKRTFATGGTSLGGFGMGTDRRNSSTPSNETARQPAVPRSENNPLGGASAFPWIAQGAKPKTPATAAE